MRATSRSHDAQTRWFLPCAMTPAQSSSIGSRFGSARARSSVRMSLCAGLRAYRSPPKLVEKCAAAHEQRGDFDLVLWREGLDARGGLGRERRIGSAEVEGGLCPA